MVRLGRSLFRLKRIASSVVVGALLALAVALLGFGGHAAHGRGGAGREGSGGECTDDRRGVQGRPRGERR